MKVIIIVLIALFTLTLAAPPASTGVEVLEQRSDVEPDRYSYALQTSDGTTKQEDGELVNAGAEDAHIVARGSFSFVAADGQTYTINYIADENGFQPQGAHLPVAPVA